MSEKLIYAEKENGKHFFAPEYDDYIQALENGDEFITQEKYGGHYDRVLVQLHEPSGIIYKSERFPAASQDFVNHLYIAEQTP